MAIRDWDVSNMPDLRDGVDWARASHFHALRDLMRSTVQWGYLPATQPTGMATAAEALFKFDGTGSALTDRTGNGHDLTLQAGATYYQSINGFTGLGFGGTSEWYRAASDSDLQPQAALTVEAICFCQTINQLCLFSIEESGETSATNSQASLYTVASTNAFTYFTETGGGTNHVNTFAASMPVGEIVMVTLTRNAAATTAKLSINGALVNSQSVTAPDGGGSARLCVGAFAGGSSNWNGSIFGMKFTKAEFSADQVLESYQRARGLVA